VKPVVIVIILGALWGLGRKAMHNGWLLALGAAVLGLYLLGGNEIGLMLGAGVLVAMVREGWDALRGGALPGLIGWTGWVAASQPFGLGPLFLVFLKVGAVLYGSGYVLLAFLQTDLVTRLAWLTQQQLIDAVAAGQLTPGPLFTTATFVGYLLGGVPGALVATAGIFLPSFFFVLASNPLIPRIRESKWAGAFLDGVNVGALGLMTAVTWKLGRAAIVDLPSAGLMLAAGLLFFRVKVNSAWLVLGGAAAGYLIWALG
jgi:chromate transporter